MKIIVSIDINATNASAGLIFAGDDYTISKVITVTTEPRPYLRYVLSVDNVRPGESHPSFLAALDTAFELAADAVAVSIAHARDFPP